MLDIASAILAINPDAKVSVNAEDYNQITWKKGTPVISKEDIQAKQAELKAEFDAKQYQRDREKEYPTWQDQLDDIYHNSIDGWKGTIKAIKDANPKP